MSNSLFKCLLFCVLAFFPLLAISQNITVNNNAPYNAPIWLVKNVLVDAQNAILPAYNPPFSGITLVQPASTQVGFFDASGTNFPLDSGIVMSTAEINVAVPNASYINPNIARPDTHLDGVLSVLGLGSQTLFDKSVIEFSFVAVSDSVEFEYIFASNEYSNYTCSNFNDVFGFFLTGHGINGVPSMSTVNIARIPNTTVPVAINTLNGGAPTGGNTASNCLTANPNYVAHSSYFINNPSLNAIGFNGYTQVLKARASVICGNVYHIKLAITDVVDGALNSAVFLGAKSFKVPKYSFTPVPNSSNTFVDTMAVEGCSPTPLVIKKSGGLIGKSIGVAISKSGTAIEGIDYQSLTDSIWMPASVDEDTIFIYAINDGLTEAPEKIIFDFDLHLANCPVVPTSAELYIRDKSFISTSVLSLSNSDTLECPNDSILIHVDVTGGDGDTLWAWADIPGLNHPDRYVSPTVNTTYYLYATDECRTDTVWDSITIYAPILNPLSVNHQEFMVCDGESVSIPADFSGGKAPYNIQWFNGSTLDTVLIFPRSDTNWVTYRVSDACGSFISDSVLVYLDSASRPFIHHEIDFGDPLNVELFADNIPRISYHWDFGDGDSSTLKNPVHRYSNAGTYDVTLTVITTDGCTKQITRTIEVEDIYELYIPNSFTPNGDGLNEYFKIYGTGVEEYDIMIFNRWGAKVFHSQDLEEPWDANFNGQKVHQGSYAYTIKIKTTFGGHRVRKGVVNVFY